jgi:hypothetical protein
MALTLKEKIAKSIRTDQINKEASIYKDAIKSGSKFSAYYQSKLDKLNVSLDELNVSSDT